MLTLRQFLESTGLLTGPRRVLVIEDDLYSATKLIDFLTEAGHEVARMAGVDSLDGSVLIGANLGADGNVSHNLTGVEVIFLDYYFLSSSHNGASLLRLIRGATPAYIVGMSSDFEANQRMRDLGADTTIRKGDLIRLLP